MDFGALQTDEMALQSWIPPVAAFESTVGACLDIWNLGGAGLVDVDAAGVIDIVGNILFWSVRLSAQVFLSSVQF